MRYNLLISFACLSLVTGPAPGLGQQRNDRTDPPEIGDRTDDRPAKGIQDNSFLIEEAYNQEPGVVQAITAFRGQGSSRSLAFVHEFPLWSQTHQFSYSVPYSLRGESRRVRGVGDVLLNYRYQALFESDTSPAFAPRISLLLPTGSTTNDTGSGSFYSTSRVGRLSASMSEEAPSMR